MKRYKVTCLVLGLRRFKGECNIYIELLFMYNMYLACMHAHTINGKSVAISSSGSVMLFCEYPQKD